MSSQDSAWMDQVRAVLFDLDGTLRHSQPTFMQAFLDIAASLDLPGSPEGRRRAARWLLYYWAQSPELVSDWATFLENPDQFWVNHARMLLQAMGVAENRAFSLGGVIAARMQAEFRPSDRLFPDTPQTLASLRDAGYRLGVVSNRRKSYEEQLTNLGLLDFFEFALYAGDLECWKPNPAIFYNALDRLGEPASSVIYVGDNYYADVIGARRAGLYPVLLDREQLFPEADCLVIGCLSALLEILP